MKNIAFPYKLLLGSTSSRRREIMSELGYDYKIVNLKLENEDVPQNLYKEEIPIYLAKAKSESYDNLLNDELLITADTIVWINDKVLGKPKDYSDAFQMLKLLNNKTHSVLTGVTLRTNKKTVSFCVETLVQFANMKDEDIRYYIEHYKPYDKAGAYGIQEWIGKIGVDYIQGSYYNVVGLPVQKLYTELQTFID